MLNVTEGDCEIHFKSSKDKVLYLCLRDTILEFDVCNTVTPRDIWNRTIMLFNNIPILKEKLYKKCNGLAVDSSLIGQGILMLEGIPVFYLSDYVYLNEKYATSWTMLLDFNRKKDQEIKMLEEKFKIIYLVN